MGIPGYDPQFTCVAGMGECRIELLPCHRCVGLLEFGDDLRQQRELPRKWESRKQRVRGHAVQSVRMRFSTRQYLAHRWVAGKV